MRFGYLRCYTKTIQRSSQQRKMALFKQVLNPITGQNEWDTRNDDYDYHQEVANAGFGDMLHDIERNKKYDAAIKKTIAQMHAKGQEVHVLDIGTGTGLLSMMAVRAGADTVTACEAFLPMANCAERILEANRMRDKVCLIKKRSTDIILGEDMSRKANLLVAELLDTELIGEGALGIYNHAHTNLLTDDVVCIPAKATCYAQVMQTSLAANWNSLKMITNLDGDVLLKPPKEVRDCKGEATLHDVQLSQIPLDQCIAVSEVNEIFEFDFNCKSPRALARQHNLPLHSKCAGSTDVVFYWWDIKLDCEGEICLTCAPFWAHPDCIQLYNAQKCRERLPKDVIPWRDHWMQAIYYIPKPLNLGREHTEFILSCNHDEYSLWFDVFPSNECIKKVPRHNCTCDLHMTYPRNRIGQMNQSRRNKKYMQYLEEAITSKTNVLSLGDGCILGLSASKMGAQSVVCHEPHRFSRHFMETMKKTNNLNNVQFVETLDAIDDATAAKFTHIFAEPYFLTSILPWDNFYFGTLLQRLKERLSSSVHISPHSAKIFALPVEFLELHKIRAPIGRDCEGFDLSLFDEMVAKSSELAQAKVEAQPLWEYPCRALAQPQDILNVVFSNFEQEQSAEGEIKIIGNGSCNGVALWVDWNINGNDANNESLIVSTGPVHAIRADELVSWDMFVRQGVQLFVNPKEVKTNESTITWSVTFKPLMGHIEVNFDINA